MATQWLWIGMVLVGFGVYLLLNAAVAGHPLRFLEYQGDQWHRGAAWPWVGAWPTLSSLNRQNPIEAVMVGLMEFLFVVLGLIATIAAWLRLRASYAVWMTGNWLMISSQSFVLSVSRYTLTLFPLFILLALADRRNRTWTAIVSFASLLLFAVFRAQFVRSHWAF